MRFHFLLVTLLLLPVHSFFGWSSKVLSLSDATPNTTNCTEAISRSEPGMLSMVLPDTLPGEAHLTKLLSKGICEQVALESRHQDLAVLTRSQGTGLLQEMLSLIIVRDSTEFSAFISKAPDADAAVQRLTIHAILRLASTCPTASKLLTHMGVQMGSVDTNLSASQEQVLQTISHGLCGQLSMADTELSLSKRSAPERIELYQQAVHAMILAHGREIGVAFGSEVFTNKQMESKLWQNLDRLMFEECPTFTAILRVDRGLARMQDTISTQSHSIRANNTSTQRKRKRQAP